MELDLRLKNVAELVPLGSRLADIGTDHGYLLISLMKNQKISHGIGCDLRPGPLGYAQKNVKKFGMSHQIELRLGDGLEPLNIDEVDGVSICGMGGGTIKGILQKKKELWNSLSFLVLQPQSDSGVLRKFLRASGWNILKERLIESDERLYEVIFAAPGQMQDNEDELIWELGPQLWKEKHPLLAKRIADLERSATLVLQGVEQAKETPEKRKQKDYWEQRLKSLREARKWLQN